MSLGSALVIFVSILHEEFYQPSIRLQRDPHVTSASNWEDPSVAVHSVASFRYGWSFYVALAAFINAELSAGLYIVLHSHAFKWHLRDKLPPPMAAAAASAAAASAAKAPGQATSKEIGVQTSPSKMVHSATQDDECNHQVCIVCWRKVRTLNRIHSIKFRADKILLHLNVQLTFKALYRRITVARWHCYRVVIVSDDVDLSSKVQKVNQNTQK